jgi:LacI family transcriptional regulator
MVTVSDVARRANVSRATAARVLGGYAAASAEVTERVLAAANELGYLPNSFARSLAKRRSYRVGVLLPDLENLFFARLFRGIETVCHADAFKVVLGNTGENEEQEHNLLLDMQSEQVEGMIIAPAYGLRKESRHSIHVPIVCVDRLPERQDQGWSWVSMDNYASAQEAVAHLVEQGYHDIRALMNLPHLSSMRERFQGFCAAMERYRRPLRPGLSTNSYQLEAITAEVEAFFQEQRPDAVVAMDSIIAMAVVMVARKLGIALGTELGLLAYDDEPWMAVVEPAITAIEQPVVEMGAYAARTLLDFIQEPARPAKTQRLAPRLIIRHSTTRKEVKV